MEVILLYVVGTAGSGKSMLTGAIKEWMDIQGYDAMTINLDPGAETLPYSPDIDIRDWIRMDEIMEEYNLGPNGAQIVAADLLSLNIGEIRNELRNIREGYVIIDTPGQMELFAFRESSRHIVSELRPDRSALLFLFDPFLAVTPSGFISQLMLSAITQFRFIIPLANVLTKIDLLDEYRLARILAWVSDMELLHDDALRERPSMEREMSISSYRLLEDIAPLRHLIPVSAVEMYGIEDIYDYVQQFFMGGEDYQK